MVWISWEYEKNNSYYTLSREVMSLLKFSLSAARASSVQNYNQHCHYSDISKFFSCRGLVLLYILWNSVAKLRTCVVKLGLVLSIGGWCFGYIALSNGHWWFLVRDWFCQVQDLFCQISDWSNRGPMLPNSRMSVVRDWSCQLRLVLSGSKIGIFKLRTMLSIWVLASDSDRKNSRLRNLLEKI